jgi:hypothetical protein
MVPKVVQSFISQFPETTNNAYKYFNYDNRVVDERAERRFDAQTPYKNPEALTDQDYNAIVAYAQTLINPVLAKYSHSVACEDALHLAIKSFDRGIYDGKINASKYQTLLCAMTQPQPVMAPVMAKGKKEEPDKIVHRVVLKQLGIKPKDVPLHSQLHRKLQKGVPHLVKQPGKGIVVKK